MAHNTMAAAREEDAFLDAASASPRDRFLLMLLERVAALEAAQAEHEVEAVEARLALPAEEGKAGRPFAERAAAAARLAGEAAHAALPGAVADVELSCSAAEMATLRLLNTVGPAIRSSVMAFAGAGAVSLLEEPEVSVRVSLRCRRVIPVLERAFEPEFARRGLRLVGVWKRGVAPGRPQPHLTTWVYEHAARATEGPGCVRASAAPKSDSTPEALMGIMAALMCAKHAETTTTARSGAA